MTAPRPIPPRRPPRRHDQNPNAFWLWLTVVCFIVGVTMIFAECSSGVEGSIDPTLTVETGGFGGRHWLGLVVVLVVFVGFWLGLREFRRRRRWEERQQEQRERDRWVRDTFGPDGT